MTWAHTHVDMGQTKPQPPRTRGGALQTHNKHDGGTLIEARGQHVPSALRCDARPLPGTAVSELTSTRFTSRVNAHQ